MNFIRKPQNFDAVIVLANEMDPQGVLNSESMARANLAANIFKEMNLPFIVTCGWAYRPDSKIKIADAFKSYLSLKRDIPESKIMTEIHSRDTVGDAFFTKRNIARPQNWKNICVVTSAYHLCRTKEIFEFIYGEDFFVQVEGADVIFDEQTMLREKASMSAFRKTFEDINHGDDENIYHRLREKHPFYNGNVYGKI